MAEFTVIKWRCDRCGDIRDKRPKRPSTVYTLIGTTEYDVAAGPGFVWKDLCGKCNAFVGDQIQRLTTKER